MRNQLGLNKVYVDLTCFFSVNQYHVVNKVDSSAYKKLYIVKLMGLVQLN